MQPQPAGGRIALNLADVQGHLLPEPFDHAAVAHEAVSLVSHEAVFRRNGMARALDGTRSFAEAEAVVKGICGRTELDHERRKAAVRSREPRVPELAAGVAAYCDAAARRGIDLLTFRRLAEAVGSRRYDPPTIRELAGDRAFPDLPLCRTRAGGDPL